ncbi:MAG: HpaII family restriction endonuclease [Clostridia bacterium]|nr:HpaII family restriction endonuclease [Clostridia bacterium]
MSPRRNNDSGNKGEWSELFAALQIVGEKRLYIADNNGQKNPSEWLEVIELIRHETKERIVTYKYNENNVDVIVLVNNVYIISVPANAFLHVAEQLAAEIRDGHGRAFTVSDTIISFLRRIEIRRKKANSKDKSDVFLSLNDPRAGIERRHIGFSIKSALGKDPTLFNTGKSSAFIYKLSNMNDELMAQINNLNNNKGKAAVQARCDELLRNKCDPVFFDLPVGAKAGCKVFKENLDLLDQRLILVFERLLSNHYFRHERQTDLVPIMKRIIEENPCSVTRPEIKYPYMMKSFVYAAYCGLTASTLWDGRSQVNGGFIKVTSTGDVIAHYALESEAFKSYLYNNCYFEEPGTDEKHGYYASVYKENGEYYFRLNFQIRYRV